MVGYDDWLEAPYVQKGYVEEAFNRWFEVHRESLEIDYMEREGIADRKDMTDRDWKDLENEAFDKWAYLQFER